jgi:hypothetical protein
MNSNRRNFLRQTLIAPLSEKSVANRSNSVDVPDFTDGNWKTNAPVELTLKGGGTMGVKDVKKTGSSV